MKLPTMGEKCRENLESHGLGYLHWRGPGDVSTPIYYGMEDHDMVDKVQCLGDEG